jgi:ribosomal protein L23
MIDATNIIKRIVISEKAAKSSEAAQQYVLEVTTNANKVSVRQAVEASLRE